MARCVHAGNWETLYVNKDSESLYCRGIAATLTVECRSCIASIGQFYITLYMFVICHRRLYFYWFIIVICCFIGQYDPSSAIKELPFAREFRLNQDADEVMLYCFLMQ